MQELTNEPGVPIPESCPPEVRDELRRRLTAGAGGERGLVDDVEKGIAFLERHWGEIIAAYELFRGKGRQPPAGGAPTQ